MGARRKSEGDPPPSRRRPATTPDAREDHLISLAAELVEKRLRDGTASAQETVHFLRLGSSRERLEQSRLEVEVALSKAKAEAIEAEQRIEEKYEKALAVMRMYKGQDVQEQEYYED